MSATRRIPTIALVGRQNAGKTSLLMHLTGSAQHPVNFPGSSVERAEAIAKIGAQQFRLVDLPGITSLEALSPDEAVALGWLRGDGKDAGSRPDVVCVVIDAGKLGVELRLVSELAKLGLPMVVALTKGDVASTTVDVGKLRDHLGMPVAAVNALSGDGATALLATLGTAAEGDTTLGTAAEGDTTLGTAAGTAAEGDTTTLGTTAQRGPPGLAAFDIDAVVRDVSTTRAASDRPNRTDRIDAVLLHRVLGLPILALIVFGIFQALFVGADPLMGLIESGQEALAGLVSDAVPEGALQAFLVDGLINGVGSVLVFLPQIILLLLFVSLLEASGYMARAAFLLDRVLSKVGLSGRSFVPMVSSFACAVPAVLSTRMIDNERERLATIAVLPLMSCSARLPVYVVLIGAFFPTSQAGIVLFSLYALGILVAAAVAWILRRTKLRGDHAVLMMELPVYQRPTFRVVRTQVWAATREFLVTAGTIIMATAVVIWVLSYYPRPEAIHLEHAALRAPLEAELEAAPDAGKAAVQAKIDAIDAREKNGYLEQSFLANAGKAIQPIFEPAGFDWRTTVGVLASFPARELIIPTLGILYSVGDVDPGEFDVASLDHAEEHRDEGLAGRLRAATKEDGSPAWSSLSALAVMVFFALCSQCMATLGAIKRETRSWRWPLFVFSYMTALAWLAAVAVYQIGSRVTG